MKLSEAIRQAEGQPNLAVRAKKIKEVVEFMYFTLDYDHDKAARTAERCGIAPDRWEELLREADAMSTPSDRSNQALPLSSTSACQASGVGRISTGEPASNSSWKPSACRRIASASR